MKRHLKFLFLAVVLTMSAIWINPPSGGVPPDPTGKRPPLPGNPPVIVVTPNNK